MVVLFLVCDAETNRFCIFAVQQIDNKMDRLRCMRYVLSCLALSLLLISCGKGGSDEGTAGGSAVDSTATIRYAEGLQIEHAGAVTLVTISDPTHDSSEVYRYALVPREQASELAAQVPEGYTMIETPVRRVIVMTTLQLSNFIKLDAVDRIVGMPSTRFLFNEEMQSRLASGAAKRIGIEGNFDSELIMALQPDIILVSPFKRGGYDVIKQLDIPLITFLGYKETSPLGQAEWLKFTALLLGMEERADTLFSTIEQRYHELQALITDDLPRPKVLSGELHGGNWYVVGGASYLAHLFEDAGADYFMADDKESGGFYVDFETVYAQAADADYWRIANSYDGTFSYDVLGKTDARYRDFKAYRDKRVLYCNLRERPFYELSPVEPEVVLADLIHAFHPQLLPDHEPVFYSILTR